MNGANGCIGTIDRNVQAGLDPAFFVQHPVRPGATIQSVALAHGEGEKLDGFAFAAQ